jgi:hypothetical protein
VKGSWLEGRFEGTDVFEGDLKIGGLGIFIPYSYNVQGLSFLHREDVISAVSGKRLAVGNGREERGI